MRFREDPQVQSLYLFKVPSTPSPGPRPLTAPPFPGSHLLWSPTRPTVKTRGSSSKRVPPTRSTNHSFSKESRRLGPDPSSPVLLRRDHPGKCESHGQVMTTENLYPSSDLHPLSSWIIRPLSYPTRVGVSEKVRVDEYVSDDPEREDTGTDGEGLWGNTLSRDYSSTDTSSRSETSYLRWSRPSRRFRIGSVYLVPSTLGPPRSQFHRTGGARGRQEDRSPGRPLSRQPTPVNRIRGTQSLLTVRLDTEVQCQVTTNPSYLT